MLLLADWEISLPDQELLLSAEYGLALDLEGLEGWLGAPSFTVDDERRVGPGVVSGSAWPGPKLLLANIQATAGSGADVGALVDGVAAAWQPPVVGILPVEYRLPGAPETVMRAYGQPRAFETDSHAWEAGLIRLRLEYLATDPLAYGVERDSEHQEGTVTVLSADAGRKPSDRLSIEIIGDGGTPTVENSAGGSITFTGALAAAEVWTVDVRTGEVAGGGAVASGSPWLRIEPGEDNEYTHSGCESIRLVWRPAY